MKRILLTTTLLSALAFTACKDDKKTESSNSDSTVTEQEMTSKEEQNRTNTSKLTFKTDKDEQLANSYFNLKDALVKTDATSAKQAANALLKNLRDETQVDLAKEIAENEDNIEVQRTAFSKLSALLAPVFSKQITSGELYKQYCPMAFDNEGAFWFSREKEIMNPYFGDKMLHCGSIQETIQ
ncbi:DUF3347 domain-containing protein [Mesonia ostreae]|uniref:DUF3347 domain-containing protein n=1 Tax=Mesonia ostreae TaxID=861110 RepID=A0ABU2KJN4_9FLAO|nr:DUF3347 domain-containing protein [Mesonia ostreae]MDT0294932.1 DUF3347 domain-containing protein [Mesonia ostreae]